MDTNMTPIDDSNIQPKQQINFLNQINEEEDDHHPSHHQQQFVPNFHQQQMYPVHEQAKDIFTGFDKTAYIIIFVAFILGFFMGKTMQPVILRPN
jgi:hypothetical protein